MPTRPESVRGRRGSAVVEFVLVLPLVLVVVLALVQVGLLVRDRMLVEAVARAGARAAALQADPGEVTRSALAAAPGLDPALAAVEVARSGARGDPVTVEVTYEDPVRLPLIGWLVGTSVTMHATAVERQEFG